MVDTERPTPGPSLRRDAILEAVAFAAERLLLATEWREAAPEVLARLGVAADVSRAYVMENHLDDEERLCATLATEWCASGIESQVGNPFLTASPWDEAFARWAEAHGRGETIMSHVRDLPDGERPELEGQGILSIVEIPIFVDGAWWGCIGLDDCLEERAWSGAEQDALRAVAGVLGAAVLRQRSDDQRREAEERYRQLVERIPAVTYTDIPDDDVVNMGFVSPQIEAILGYPPERFMQDPAFWGGLIHPEDLASLRAAGAFDPTDTTPFDHEYRMTAADGHQVWVNDTSTSVFHDDGSIDYFLGFMTDITRRKEAEEQLRRAEERFRLIVERTPAIVYLSLPEDEGGTGSPVVYASPQIERILGYPQDAWTEPGSWIEQIHPDDRERVVVGGTHASRTGDPYSDVYRMLAADGRVVWFHDESVLIRGEADQPVMWQGVMVDVTEQKAAEQRLRSAEDRHRALVEHIPAVVYAEAIVASADALYLSPQVERVFGFPSEVWRETPNFWRDHIHPDDSEMVADLNAEANRIGAPFHAEYRFRTADDTYRWIHDEAVRVLDDEGEPLFWQGVLIDITLQREAEVGRKDAEARFRVLVEHIPAVVYTESPDADPSRFYISPQVESLFGYTAQEWTWTEDFWINHIHPDDLDGTLAVDEASNRTHEPYDGEYRFRLADGRWIWVRDEARFVEGPDGDGFWQGFMLDITQRKEAEQQLREAELKFRTIVEQNQAIFYTQEIDPDDPSISRTTYIAPGNTEMLGYTLDEVTQDPTLWRAITHPDDRDRVFAADAESNLEGDESFSLEYRMIAKDGRIVWVQDEAMLVHLPDKPPYWQGFLLDITERKEAEARLERALSVEREAGQRLRALDDMKNTFLQAVSHDLRTPLAAILGLAITLERGDVHLSEVDARDLARRIAGNARRLDRLVMNLLDLDRLARGIVAPKLEPTDVGDLVQRALAESELVPQARLRTNLQPLVVPVDAAKVERIVENLLANTARHTPSDATIWVSVTEAADPAGVILAVEDDGTGVPEDLRETIFEPFRQGPDAPQHSPGVGVGLTLVRRFAQLHGGRAWVESREGGGASFRVFLPAEAAPDIEGPLSWEHEVTPPAGSDAHAGS
jgi:PAS domain S-box-containing protein